jgi:hypothetical protein
MWRHTIASIGERFILVRACLRPGSREIYLPYARSELRTLPLMLEKMRIHRQNLGSARLQAAFRQDSGTFS